jgi:integrase-like protein
MADAVRSVTYWATAGASVALREATPLPPRPLRLLEGVWDAIGVRHYSLRTEKAYVHRIMRYIFFHGKRHPAEMGVREVTTFLTSLAVDGRVAAPTQNEALSALLFLYRDVLEVDLPWLDEVVRAKRPDDPDLHPRAEPRPCRGAQPGRPHVRGLTMSGRPR